MFSVILLLVNCKLSSKWGFVNVFVAINRSYCDGTVFIYVGVFICWNVVHECVCVMLLLTPHVRKKNGHIHTANHILTWEQSIIGVNLLSITAFLVLLWKLDVSVCISVDKMDKRTWRPGSQ